MHFWHFRSTLDIIFSIIVKQQLLPAKLIQLWFLINRALTNVCIIIKPHRSATQMWPIVTDGPAWTASLLGSSALQKRLNWFRCRLGCGFGCAQGTMYYIGKNGRPTVSIRTLCRELCKNGWTNQDAVWDVNSGGPKETSVRLGFKSPHTKGQFRGGKWPAPDMSRNVQQSIYWKWLSSRAAMIRCGCRLGCIRAGVHWHNLANMTEPSMQWLK